MTTPNVGSTFWTAALTQTAVKTAAYTAHANELVRVDTTSGSVTVTLPAQPAAGTLVAVKMVIQGGSNTVTVTSVAGDVFNKAGGSTTLALSLLSQGAVLEYQAGIWMVLADDLPLGQLDARYLPLPSGTATAGQVPVATGAGNASAWGSGGGGSLPLTTLGDTLYENATPAAARLPGNTSATKNFMTQTGNGTISAAPAWGTIAAADLPAGTTSAQGALQLDGTAGDIQPSPATQAAGAVGKPADAAHVHGQPPVLAPTGLTGATAASRYAGATTSGPPQTGTFSAGDYVVDQSGPVWLCSTGGSPGNWKQAGDQPWQFRPETYGALRNGKFLTDGAMAANSTLTSATAGFTSADVGKCVLVWGAITSTNSQPGYLFTTISSVTNATTVVCAAAATNTVTNVGVLYGTDDTAALQSAVNAATTYSLTGSGALAQVLLSEGVYCSGTAATLGTTTGGGNAAITLPIVSATSGVKAQIQITGAGCSQLPHWTQPQPPQSGSIIAAMRTNGSLNNTYGPTSIIGGPVSGYGGGGGTFSNMHIRLQGFTILVPVSAGAYCGPDLYGLGQASVDEVSYLPIAVIPTSTTWPALSPGSGISYGGPTYWPSYTFGLRMPADGNNAVADIGSFTSYFTQISLIGSEHTTFQNFRSLFSQYGLLAMTNTGGTVSHGITGLHYLAQQTRYPIGSVSSGYFALGCAIGVVVTRLDLESYTQIVNDGASKLYGDVGFNIIAAAGSYLATQYASGGTTLKLRRIEAAQGPIASPQAAPATTVAWPNYYYRDAWITVSLSGGNTFTSLNIDAVAQPNAAGAGTYSFMLPSGHSYTPAYSAGTLTHTVSLQ